jgi:FkbM family methyltransferase
MLDATPPISERPGEVLRSSLKWALRKILAESQLAILKDLEFRVRLLVGAHYEKEVDIATALVGRGSTFVDVGANIGQYTVPLSRTLGPSGAVVSLEPAPDVRSILEGNVKRYGLENVTILPYAASDRAGYTELYTPLRDGRRSLQESAIARTSDRDSVMIVSSIPLDSLGLLRCDLIKVDTEGAELLVVQGAQELLRRCRPVLLLEVEAKYCARFGYSPSDLVEVLQSAGYVVGTFDGPLFVRLPNAAVGLGGNVFCLPRESIQSTSRFRLRDDADARRTR